jgi:hypothetical protein
MIFNFFLRLREVPLLKLMLIADRSFIIACDFSQLGFKLEYHGLLICNLLPELIDFIHSCRHYSSLMAWIRY